MNALTISNGKLLLPGQAEPVARDLHVDGENIGGNGGDPQCKAD